MPKISFSKTSFSKISLPKISFSKISNFKFSKYLFYFLIFSLPLIAAFSPKLSLAFSQKLFLGAVSFLILFFWLIEIFITGKLKIKTSKSFFALLAFLFFSVLSFAFSGSVNFQNFFGDINQVDSLFVLIVLGLVFFFALNFIENKNEAKIVLKLFLASSTIAAISFLIQYFLGNFLYSSIGSFQARALLFSFALLSALCLLFGRPINFKKLSSKIFIVLTSLSFVILFASILIINFELAWFLISIGSLILFWQGINEQKTNEQKISEQNGGQNQKNQISEIGKKPARQNLRGEKQNNFNPRLAIFPLILFIVSAFLFLVQPQVGKPFNPEIYPSYSLSFEVAKNVLLESPKNFLFGWGPATFYYQFLLFKGQVFNNTQFQLISFDQSACAFLTLLSCLGFLAILSLLFLFIYASAPAFRANSKILTLIFPLLLLFFLYRFNLVLATFGVIFLAMCQVENNGRQNSVKIIELKKLPKKQLFCLIIFLAFFALSLVFGIYKIYQEGRAEIIYQETIEQYNQGSLNIDQAIEKIEMLNRQSQKDYYLRDLSQLYLLKANQVYQEQTDLTQLMPEDIQSQFNAYAKKSQDRAKLACQINPKNSKNFENYGDINLQLIFFIEESAQLAIEAYQKAEILDPQNYNYPLALVGIYQLLGEKDKADSEYQKAVDLNSAIKDQGQ